MSNCGDCGQDHSNPALITDLIAKVRFRYRLYVAAYFLSLAVAAFGSWVVFGWGGPVVTVALFFIHLSHLNMNAMTNHLYNLKEAIRPVGKHDVPTLKPSGGTYL